MSEDTKMMLKAVANKLKNNPEVSVMITAYPDKKDIKQQIADRRLNNIINFLTDKLGISNERLVTDMLIDGGNSNTIDFKSQ